MITKLSSVKAYNKKDNLIVLTDKSNLSWAKDLLNKEEILYLKTALKNDIFNVMFPKASKIILVQALNTVGTYYEQREEARIFGSETLHKLEQQKIKKVTIINERSQNHVLDFIEGMVLTSYCLLYTSDAADE